jgi:Outer membrane protein beta-barrel domain
MIKNEFYGDEFEQLLKEKADQFSMYPSKRVWHSIYNNLHPGRRWPSVVISLVLISSLMLIGYLNTGQNSITSQINNGTISKDFNEKTDAINSIQNISPKTQVTPYSGTAEKPAHAYNNAFEDVITNETDMYTYTVVKSNRPVYLHNLASLTDVNASTVTKPPVDNITAENDNGQEIVQSVDAYIKSSKIFTDVTVNNKKYKNDLSKSADKNINTGLLNGENLPTADNLSSLPESTGDNTAKTDLSNLTKANTKEIAGINNIADKNTQKSDEKAWIENYALQNKPAGKKWKGRLGYQIYVTPAVNYRKLSSKTQYSATPFAEGDINKSISQKPGVGIEAGIGLNYAVAKKLQIKGGVQFNYTNYNINADETNHPILTNILLNDPSSGLSYSSARVSTISNPNNSTALKPITLHNTTYQISIPVGFAYKLSSHNNVDWFAGATAQPSYVFGGNAHIISSDLKSYISEPSSIRTWNLNLGFETYMNFKMGTCNLQVGPQVRYQVNSTYKKNVALVEKPYAVGLKLGLTKGF